MVRKWSKQFFRIAGIVLALTIGLLLTTVTVRAGGQFTDLVFAQNGFYLYDINVEKGSDILNDEGTPDDYQAFINKISDPNEIASEDNLYWGKIVHVRIKPDFIEAISQNMSYTGMAPDGNTITWSPGDPLPDPTPNGGVGVGTSGVDHFQNCDLSRIVVGSYSYFLDSINRNVLASVTTLDLSKFTTGSIRDMARMFNGCSGLKSLNLSSFDTSNVEEMSVMFRDCSSLTSLDLSSFNTSKVNSMAYMFDGCSSLTSLDLSSFDISGINGMLNGMFRGCNSLTSLDLSSFDTSHVDDMNSMFKGCSSLTSLDLSSFDFSAALKKIQSKEKESANYYTQNPENYPFYQMFADTCADNTTGTAYSGKVMTEDYASIMNSSDTGIDTAKLKFTGSSASVESISLSAQTVKITPSAGKGTAKIKIVMKPSNAVNQKITCSIKGSNHIFASVDDDHTITLWADAEGTAQLTVTSVETGVSATCKVTAVGDFSNKDKSDSENIDDIHNSSADSVQSISLSAQTVKITPYNNGGTAKIKAVMEPSDAINQKVTCSIKGSNHIFASVDDDHTITLWADAEGTAQLTVTSVETGVLATCDVTAIGDFSRKDKFDKAGFGDVYDSSAYYYEPVYWASYYGITSGTGQKDVVDSKGNPYTMKLFSPSSTISRGQMITFLYRYYQNMSEKSGEHYGTDRKYNNPFSDVGVSYYTEPIAWAAANGITQGTGGNKFSPEQPVTRGQMVTFLCRAGIKFGNIDEKSIPSSSTFSDVKESSYYSKAVTWASAVDVTQGYQNGKFGPDDPCTRAQGVTFLFRSNQSDQLMK
ncbi:S-layer homology domain-containing protein [Bilifractor sp. HCP3S3_D3]|uniref:S-layer homology domain-containing protein n=1 Tax=Bilifractor sp. HCP3S3_D3 TaxID=3438907 RepID=UPI003F8AC98F